MASNKELIDFYRAARQSDVVGSVNYNLPGNASPKDNASVEVTSTILSLLINSVDFTRSGLISTDEIVQKLNGLSSNSNSDVVKGISDGSQIKIFGQNFSFPVGSQLGEPFLNSWKSWLKKPKNINVFALNAPYLSFSVRDLDRLVLFLNSVPTVDFNLCQPVLDVKFETLIDDDKTFSSLSLIGDLKGPNYTPKDGTADAKMLQSSVRPAPQDSTVNAQFVTTSGMELFTTPQTMGRDRNSSTGEAFDPFRPLASIESFEVTVAPSVGAFTYKTAKLNLIIHDRSRLGTVADLLRPSNLPRTGLSITYGWNHPDKSGNNSYGSLLNSMIVRDEKYNIVNSSFTMDGAGGVKITLQLAMKGSQATKIGRIADGNNYIKAETKLQEIAESINTLRQKTGFIANDISKEVRAYQVIDSIATTSELPHDFKDEDIKKINNLIKKAQATAKKGGKISVDSLTQLQQQLKFFFDGAEDKKKTITGVLDEKIKNIATGQDPFLDPKANYWGKGSGLLNSSDIEKMQNGTIDSKKGDAKHTRPVVSMAKLLTTFIGESLSSTHSDSELQFFYYPLNYSAGKAAGSNISSFPIEISRLRDLLDEQAKKNGNPNFTLAEFVGFINSNFINDVRSYAYGMRQFYNPSVKTGEQPKLAPGKKIDDIMATITAETGGNFKMPVVEIYVETTNSRSTKSGPQENIKEIVRVHIYDKLHSNFDSTIAAYRTQSTLQAAMDESKKVNGVPNLQSAAQAFQQLGANVSVGSNGNFNFGKSLSLEEVKRAVSTLLPTIKYGVQHTAVLAASVQTQQNQLLSTVNMQRTMGKRSNSEPNGSSVGTVPLRVQPAQMNLTLLGCPLLNVNQQLFFDFGTGTTIDNLYLISGLSHTISPGSFRSTATLAPLDSYGVYESIFTKAAQLSTSLQQIIDSAKK